MSVPSMPTHGNRFTLTHARFGDTLDDWLSLAYLDPGNLESDLQSGAYTSYSLLWVLFLSTVFGGVLQVLSLRLGVVTGKNLAQTCRSEYSPIVSKLLWIMTELAIIGSDVQEVVGSAIAFKILFGWPLYVGCLVTAFDTFTFLGLHYFGMRKLEAFIVVLILTMTVTFFINMGAVAPPASEIFQGWVVPDIPDYAITQAVGTLGAVIMPHNIYLHSALVQSRKVDRGNRRKVAEANKYNTIDASSSLFVSFLINVAVVTAFAGTFFNLKCAQIPSGPYCALPAGMPNVTCYSPSPEPGLCCGSIGLQETGYALRGTLGDSAKYFWAIGLLAAGQASTMTGTFAGQYVMEGFLNLKVKVWVRLLITRSVALVPAMFVAYAASRADKAVADSVDEWLNVLQSVQLPFALLPVLHFTSSKKLMGEFKNGPIIKVVGWVLALLVIFLNFYSIISFVTDPDQAAPDATWFYALVITIGCMYVFFIGVIVKDDAKEFASWVRSKLCGGPSSAYERAPKDTVASILY